MHEQKRPSIYKTIIPMDYVQQKKLSRKINGNNSGKLAVFNKTIRWKILCKAVTNNDMYRYIRYKTNCHYE